MTQECGIDKTNVVEIARNTQGTPTAKLIAVLIASGITDTKTLSEITGLKPRAIQCARSAAQCAQLNAHAQHNAPGAQQVAPGAQQVAPSAAQCASKPEALVCADNTTRATNELPTEVLSSRVEDNNIITPNAIFDLLADAAGNALNPLAINLQFVSEPLGWIAKGADIHLDVLPVVRGLSSRRQPHSISSWAYYSQAVSNAVSSRLRGLPEATAASTKPKTAKPTIREVLAQRSAAAMATGVAA